MSYLSGKCLVAMPGFEDDFFSTSLIYICSHTQEGAFGFVINKAIDNVSFEDVAKELINVNTNNLKQVNIYKGGPLDKVRGFVLHSTDYMTKDSVAIDEKFAVSSSLNIISDIAQEKGPQNNLVVLGYASWSNGQLENEIKNNNWLVIDADQELLFKTPDKDKWFKAFSKLGLTPTEISLNYGHA
ncbi:MAG: YqgE/AlgH family protein [Alphaproteobacteria bacterium]